MQPKSVTEQFDSTAQYLKTSGRTVNRLFLALAISLCLNIGFVVWICIHFSR